MDGSSESFERLGHSSQVTKRVPQSGFFAHEHPFSNRFTFRTPKKDPTHATYRCRNEACGWRCSAYKNSDGILQLRVKERTHTCTTTSAHGAASSKEWLDEVVSSHIQVNRVTKPVELIELVSVHYNEKISYKVAQLCRLRLLTGGIGHQRYSFQLLPAYRDAVELQAPGARVDLSIDPATGKCTPRPTTHRCLLSLKYRQVTSSAASFVRRNHAPPSYRADVLLL